MSGAASRLTAVHRAQLAESGLVDEDDLAAYRSVGHDVIASILHMDWPRARGGGIAIDYLRPDGTAMTDADWNSPGTDCLVMALNGELGERDVDGHPLRDSAFLVVLNRGDDEVPLVLPRTPYGDSYRRLLDTDDKRPTTATKTDKTGSTVRVAPRSVALFRVETT